MGRWCYFNFTGSTVVAVTTVRYIRNCRLLEWDFFYSGKTALFALPPVVTVSCHELGLTDYLQDALFD
jgi:hypothetical protein